MAVTGGAGFIGGNLVRLLLSRDHSVSVIDDLSTGHRHNLVGLDVSLIEGSILDAMALDEALAAADAVVHLAALGSVPRSVANPLATHHANATGTLMVLDAARRHGNLHTIVASSSSVYGSNPVLPKHEELATRPMSPYAVSKLATEGYALAWSATFGIPTLAFRFFNVFGPLQAADQAYAAVIPSFVRAALNGQPVTVHGEGTQSRDFTYVGNVVAVLVDAVERQVTGPTPVNLAFGARISLLELLDRLEKILGHAIDRVHVETRSGDVPHSQADDTNFRAMFPDVAPADFETALRATVAWMQNS